MLDFSALSRGGEPVPSDAANGFAVRTGAGGLTAASASSEAGINTLQRTGFHHDQIGVRCDWCHDAPAALREMSRA
ncbi:MAG: hypothetical protein C0524_08065 [Rhodobacter sp.]|nr:hypothetical protein [Rhodobacter sp.]